MLSSGLQKLGLLSKKYILLNDELIENAKDGEACRQIQYKNTAQDAKIDIFYITFYSQNGMTDQDNETHGITISIRFKDSKYVTDFDQLCFDPIKPLYKNHCYTMNNKGQGVNGLSIFTYDKEIAKNFLLAIQKLDVLDGDTRTKLSKHLAFEIPAASANYTPVDISIIDKMYQVGEKQCRMR